MDSRNLYIIAGPNGSGKTTFARQFLPSIARNLNFVNADFIAQGFSPFAPERAAIKAGKLLLNEIHRLAGEGKDFAFETTLSGKAYVSFIKKLKQKSYKIHLFYLWIPSVNLALQRIKQRVAAGGHDIPEPDVRRRFQRSLDNFFCLYRPLADVWALWDNSEREPHLVAREADGALKILDGKLFSQISKGAY